MIFICPILYRQTHFMAEFDERIVYYFMHINLFLKFTNSFVKIWSTLFYYLLLTNELNHKIVMNAKLEKELREPEHVRWFRDIGKFESNWPYFMIIGDFFSIFWRESTYSFPGLWFLFFVNIFSSFCSKIGGNKNGKI